MYASLVLALLTPACSALSTVRTARSATTESRVVARRRSPFVGGTAGRLGALSAGESDETKVAELRAAAAALRAEVEALQVEADTEARAAKARREAEEAADPVKAARKARIEERAADLKDLEEAKLRVAKLKQKQTAPERQGDEVAIAQRALACLPYMLPLSDVLPFGNYFLNDFPLASLAFLPAMPFIALITALPFGGFIFFIALTTLTRNPEIPRFTRFNVQQAILLDIALIFPQLLGALAGFSGTKLPEALVEPASTTVFFAVSLSVLYSTIQNARGEVPNQIPVVSEAAESAIGPM